MLPSSGRRAFFLTICRRGRGVGFGTGLGDFFEEFFDDVERGEALGVGGEIREDAVAQDGRRGAADVGAAYVDAAFEDGRGFFVL